MYNMLKVTNTAIYYIQKLLRVNPEFASKENPFWIPYMR